MSFPKAKLKRFNDISVFSSPFGDSKKEAKCGGSAKKEKEKDKEIKEKDKDNKSVTSGSEMESVKSSKYRLFRTPSLPRRLKFRSTHESTPKPKSEPFPFPVPAAVRQKEQLDAAQIEISNKNETITEYQNLIDELKNENHRLEAVTNEIRSQKRKMREDLDEMEKEMNCLKKSNDLLQSIAQGSLDKIVELEKERSMMVEDFNKTLDEVNQLNESLKGENKSLSDELKFVKQDVESYNVSLKECEVKMGMVLDENYRLKSEIRDIKNQAENDMFNFVQENQMLGQKVEFIEKELNNCMSELKKKQDLLSEMEDEFCEKQLEIDYIRDELREEYTNQIENLEKVIADSQRQIESLKSHRTEDFVTKDSSNLVEYYEDEMKKLRCDQEKEVDRLNQVNEEKVRISEIQYEEKIKMMEMTWAQEKQQWNSEMQQCQKIAESEIMQSEFEKRDLKAILDSANELMREKDEKIDQLEAALKTEETTYVKIREDIETEIAELKKINNALMTEKHNYQLTLNSTRSTVQILMERLKKSDTDVELLKTDIDLMTIDKSNMEVEVNSLKEQLLKVGEEKEEYKTALNVLKSSAEALQKEMKEKESIFEKLMTSEEETLATVNNIGQMFNEKVEQNMARYYEMYNELKKKYEARESYIKDMKTLLDEFATGIEFARMELETKDKKIVELEEENKIIKLENMTYKFKCESFEKYNTSQTPSSKVPPPTPDLIEDTEDGGEMVPNMVIQNIINDLENNDVVLKKDNPDHRIDLLQEIVEGENEEIKYLKSKLGEMINKLEKTEQDAKESYEKYSQLIQKQTENNEDTTAHLKTKLKEQEDMINELKELMISHTTNSCPTTPRKMNRSGRLLVSTTPKTPKNLFIGEGKENLSPLMSPKNILREKQLNLI
uniref:Miranda n=1 Tax=Clogmia albipunctata TaxID=85120 RepID=A0A5P8HWS8_CLOAL|nr:miranda [Clogmia albipunctata]